MGLALNRADDSIHAQLDHLADLLAENTNIEAMLTLARSAPRLALSSAQPDEKESDSPNAPACRPRIGFVLDDALWFYYQENLDALRDAGAELVPLSLLDPAPWPQIDGLYLGGGYPELYAEAISASPHLEEIRALSLAGRPVYAECGGFMVLCSALLLDNGPYPMAGLFPPRPRFYRRPQGLGYVTARTLAENPFHPVGSVWTGHEFHYSRCEWPDGVFPEACLALKPGVGMFEKDGTQYDGLLTRRTFACWTHLFAPAVPHWASNFVEAAR